MAGSGPWPKRSRPPSRPHIGPDGSAVLPSAWSGEIRLGPVVVDDLERHDEALLPSRLAAPTLHWEFKPIGNLVYVVKL